MRTRLVTFVDQAHKIVGLSGDQYVALLDSFAGDRVIGGRSCDRVIATCFREGKASVLLTFNRHHFEGYDDGLEIAQPQ